MHICHVWMVKSVIVMHNCLVCMVTSVTVPCMHTVWFPPVSECCPMLKTDLQLSKTFRTRPTRVSWSTRIGLTCPAKLNITNTFMHQTHPSNARTCLYTKPTPICLSYVEHNQVLSTNSLLHGTLHLCHELEPTLRSNNSQLIRVKEEDDLMCIHTWTCEYVCIYILRIYRRIKYCLDISINLI